MTTLTGHTDRESLIAQAKTGDAAALGTLLECYRPYLMLLARLEIGRRLQGKADPTDLVQETFLEAVRQFSHFRGTDEVELTVWLRRIFAGGLAMMIRRYYGTKARDVRLERTIEDELEQSSRTFGVVLECKESSPSHRASRREQAVLLADALQHLPPDYREVIVLRGLEGLPFREVAERMGRSTVAVERLWIRGLPRLKRLLERPS
jgi:RNA polymerase sigma-70 factor (ECF subfamily)